MRVLLLDFSDPVPDVAYYAPRAHLPTGMAQFVYLALALQKSGEFHPVAAARKGSPLLRAVGEVNMPVLPVGGSPAGRATALARASRLIQQSTGDWIIHSNDPASLSFAARLADKFPQSRMVHSRRAAGLLPAGPGKGKYLKAHALACSTRESGGAALAGLIPPERVAVIPPGIEPGLYETRKPRNDGRLVFVCASPTHHGAGQRTIIEALPSLPIAGLPAWELRLIGDGPFGDLLEFAAGLRVDHHLSFLGGQDHRKMLADCDLLIDAASTNPEGSYPVKEAWAAKLPVIAADLPANTELITHGKNGLLFRNQSPQALAAEMTRAGSDPALREHLAANGHESMRAYTNARMAAQYMRLYRALFN